MVDEQTAKLSAQGFSVLLVCRSREAILLDNEAEPETFSAPSAEMIEKKLLAPFGLRFDVADKKRMPDQLTAAKGESCWTVLNRFCTGFLGAKPFVDADGTVKLISPEKTAVELTGVMSAKIKLLPCKRINQVWQQSFRGSYDTKYNGDMRGILRRRFLSAESAVSPKELIAESETESKAVTVECAGSWWHCKNAAVSVSVPKIGRLIGCEVRSIKYKCDSSGERTELELCLPANRR